MTSPNDLPAYLGWLVDAGDKPVGTCFPVAPGVLVTASHVLRDVGAGRVGARVRVGMPQAGTPASATVHAIDDRHDLAVLVSSKPFSTSLRLRASTSVRTGTRLRITGIAEFSNDPPFRISSTAATWHGRAFREDGVHLGVVDAPNLTKGMSGAPVRGRGDRVVGVVLSRYRVAGNDRYLEHAVWVARTEDLRPLLTGTAAERIGRVPGPARLAGRTVAAVAAVSLLGGATPTVHGEPRATGDLSLAHQGTPTLLFTPLTDGLAICSHSDQEWTGPWHGIDRNPDWAGIDAFAAMGSSYGGIEVLARRGDRMFFGWRSGDLRWHKLRQIEDPGRVRGRPALLEWGDGDESARAFIGVVPDLNRGIRVYLRDDYRTRFPYRWVNSSVIAQGLGRVDAVAATLVDDTQVLVTVQKGTELFRLQGRPVAGRDAFGIRWGRPALVLDEHGDPVRAAGGPSAVLTDTIGDRTAVIVVPTREGAALLTATGAARWATERVPLDGPVDAITVLDGENSAGRVFIVVGRRGYGLVSTVRSPDGEWADETKLRCRHDERPVHGRE